MFNMKLMKIEMCEKKNRLIKMNATAESKSVPFLTQTK